VKTFDWVSFMRQHPILSALEDRHLQWLLSEQASIERTYEPGDAILREGDMGDSLFVIGCGSVEAFLPVTGEETLVLSTMSSGETFGEMGLFERRPRSASVRAREASIVLEIKGENLRRVAEAKPDIEFNVLLKVSERLRSKNEQILALHLKATKKANRAKDEFLAMLGHELRNPVGAISTAVHVLEKILASVLPGGRPSVIEVFRGREEQEHGATKELQPIHWHDRRGQQGIADANRRQAGARVPPRRTVGDPRGARRRNGRERRDQAQRDPGVTEYAQLSHHHRRLQHTDRGHLFHIDRKDHNHEQKQH
jgi:CRP-like cAMP-binding protein